MRIALGRSVALVSHRPRHAEVDQEHTTGFEPNNQILAAPLEGCDGLSLELCRDLAGHVRRDWRNVARRRGAMVVPRPRTQGASVSVEIRTRLRTQSSGRAA